MLKVLQAGLFTTLQDGGRVGFLDKGVPVAGFMDTISAHRVNQLLENPVDAGLLEITMTGPTLQFEEACHICVGGAQMMVTLNQRPLHSFKVAAVQAGDMLSFGKLEKGFRSYLGVKNGFKSKEVLGSMSFYKPLTPKSHLEEGDEIRYAKSAGFEPKITELRMDSFLEESVLEVSQGPEYNLLGHARSEQLFSQKFTVSNQNDRMAYQLKERLLEHDSSMLTSATLPGTVQLTPSGRIIILMKDGQTTGGYPRILQLSDQAISVLAQKKFGDRISFRMA